MPETCEREKRWSGSASELLGALNAITTDANGKATELRKRHDWPKSPNALSSQLRRLAPALREAGIGVTFDRTEKRKTIALRQRVKGEGKTSSGSSGSSATSGSGHDDPAENHRHGNPTPSSYTSDSAYMTSTTDDLPTPNDDAISTIVMPISSGADDPDDPDDVLQHSSTSQPAPAMPYTLVVDRAGLVAAVESLAEATVLGLDTETTGLSPQSDRLRLLQLATPDGVWLIDTWTIPGWQEIVLPLLADPCRTIVGHNLKFDLQFLLAAGLEVDAGCYDTMIAAQLLDAGQHLGEKGRYSLAGVAARELGHTLDKTEQKGGWDAPTLPTTKLAYAAADAAILLPLRLRQATTLKAQGLLPVAVIEMGCVPAMAWLEFAGMPFDTDAWATLSDAAVCDQQDLEQQITTLLTEHLGADGLFGRVINLDSPVQIGKALANLGVVLPTTEETGRTTVDDAALAAVADQHAVIPLLLAYRDAAKRAGTYGIAFAAKHIDPTTGRIHANYGQCATAAGRMSCKDPNLQNIPHAKPYRACFRAPEGRALVKCDYSQIELRIAAVIAQDAVMLAAYRDGEDLHTKTAASVLNVSTAEVTKEHRQLAKALNFGLIYGMGATRLAVHAATGYGVRLTPEQAAGHRTAFFTTYQGLRRWHQSQPRTSVDTRTLIGRQRMGVEAFSQKLNSPVQGSGADGLKAALGRLWWHRHEAPTARLVATVHDEIVAECPAEDAETVAEWLRRNMIAGMQEIVTGVPIEVEATIARDWAGTPLETEHHDG